MPYQTILKAQVSDCRAIMSLFFVCKSAGRTPSRLWLNHMLWDRGRDESLTEELNPDEFSAITPHTKGGMFVDTYRYIYPEKVRPFLLTLSEINVCFYMSAAQIF